ncbi:MAG TPA: amidophosphoribosyltransferase [Patescibacteria group bacterium]
MTLGLVERLSTSYPSSKYLRRFRNLSNSEFLGSYEKELSERCAVFGVYSESQNAAALVHTGLWALQHRGQEASGIVSLKDGIFVSKKGEGLVNQVYKDKDLPSLFGKVAIGHNRYATDGGKKHIQPVISKKGLVALSHNGTLPETKKIKKFLNEKNINVKGLNDSELMQRAIEYYVEEGLSIEDAIKNSYPLFTGAFSLTIMSEGKLIGLRDSHGVRPLSIGSLKDGGYALSSETVGLDKIGASFIGDVKPGEMVVISDKGLEHYQIEKGKEQLDVFEIIYFANPDSIFYGKKVNDLRRALGRQLAQEMPIEADVVVGVPNTALPAASAYSEEANIRYDPDILHKNSYIHRTFIDPSPGGREENVRRKFSVMQTPLKGKRVIVVDDSIVRGPTTKVLVEMLREKGAKEVSVVVTSPPVRYPDFYGINTPRQEGLIASKMSVDKIKEYIGADKLYYLSYKGMIKAIGIPEEKLCTSCLTGKYPIDIGENAKHINFSV